MKTYLEPTRDAGVAFLRRGIAGEVVMLNLLRLRDCTASLEDSRLLPLTALPAPI
ncbi:hypothetical protein [Methylocella sp.]|jgi:hypothetical protein|uniref:hypothetical protein n=1 Tax=Methylocella sp. TaxID=1978226 RepID=UPI003C1425E9